VLTLAQRKAFAWRAAVSGAARDEDFADKDTYLDVLQGDARKIAETEIRSPSTGDLTAFLGLLPARLRANDIHCDDPDRSRLRRRVLQRAARARCRGCAVASALSRPCDGRNSPREWSLIEKHGGRCVGEIQQSWKFACQLAHDYYTKAVPELPDVTLDLRIEFTDQRPPLLIPGHPISFLVGVDYERGRFRRSTVVLRLAAHRYEVRCADDLLPAILHEAFCHVWQMAAGRPPRELDRTYDSLAEGWMDFIVGLVVKRELGARAGFLSTRISAAADKLHLARADQDPGGGQEQFAHALSVSRGAGAARAVLGWFSAIGATEKEFLDLSLRLNAHPWRGAERDAACRKLKEWLFKPGTRPWTVIDKGLRDARENSDAGLLIDALRRV
jgi:hypothetical protein